MKKQEASNKALLLQKIFAVMEAIPELEKTGEMKEGGEDSEVQYKYHEADGIRGPLRDQLIANRLLLMPTDVEFGHWVNPTSTGGSFNYSEQKITFSWFDIDTGEQLDCAAVGHGGDSLDKGAPKASIQALKYFVTNGLHIKGLKLDGDSPEEQNAGKEANRQFLHMEGVPDICLNNISGEPFDHPWILIDGIRAFAISKKHKTAGTLKKLSRTEPIPSVKVRYFMGMLDGNKNAQPVIDRISIVESAAVETGQ